jgi:xanthine dehydrogenase accessory factor
LNEPISTILETLAHDGDLVVATIVGHEGSTPRTAGTKMIVRRNGEFFGTIGGGQVEADVLAAASDAFTARTPALCDFDMTQETLSGMDMICGGKMTVLIDFYRSDPETLDLLNTIQTSLQLHRPCILVTAIGGASENFSRFLLEADTLSHGQFPYADAIIQNIINQTRNIRVPKTLTLEKKTFWVEPYFKKNLLFIFGAGHVSRPTASMGNQVGFQVFVLDDREEFANQERFPAPAMVRVVPSFEDCVAGLEIDEHSYLVIVTRGHLNDKIVLSQALGTKAGYIGMIGSRRKRDMIYKALLGEGFSSDDLRRVHSPIGLSIGAETPEEIAVSILSELIRVKSRKSS